MRKISLFIIAIATTGMATAQVPKSGDGAVFSHDIISAASALTVAQHSSYGTARSMAMGGAFASLGADMASTAINPAGLGMYRHNDVSMTFAVNISSANTPGTLKYNDSDNTRTTFGVNNAGIAMQVYNGKGALKSITMAITYNKVANFNYEATYCVPAQNSSYAYALRDIANRNGLWADGRYTYDRNNYCGYEMSAYYWGNVLGYNNYLLSYLPDGHGGFSWENDRIGSKTSVDQFYNIRSRGSAGETSVAFGGNYKDKLFFGASLDITSFTRRVDVYYGEEYFNNEPLPEYLQYFNYDQSTKMSAVGVRAKFGLTYRPTKALRIGVAFHTPTYYAVNYYYEGGMSALRNGGYMTDDITWLKNDVGDWGWSMVTPLSVIAGASCMISNKAILSVDYQYDEYDALHFNSVSPDADYMEESNAYMKSVFQGTHTVRAGLEIKPSQKFAIRGGGGWKTCSLQDGVTELTQPVVNSLWYFTCGLGFNLSSSSRLDLAYSYQNEDTTSYRLFYSETTSSQVFNTAYSKHNIALSLGFYF